MILDWTSFGRSRNRNGDGSVEASRSVSGVGTASWPGLDARAASVLNPVIDS